MSGEPQLYRINPQNRESEKIQEVEFAQLGLQERRDIQEWVAANPGILGDDLLIIGKEFSGFDRTNERLDLLAVDRNGKLVIIELKRDDTGADAHWQAIKYASYFQRATADDIVKMMAEYRNESEDESTEALVQHLGGDDLIALNNDQRIILASHRFAPEVTSAALWLNWKVPGENLITCVKLTPHRDTQTETLYVQASTIIPVPGIDEYLIGVGQSTPAESAKSGSFGSKLAATFARNRNDEVSQFLRNVGRLATDGLPDGIRPDRMSRWGGVHSWGGRYYHFWYQRHPWNNYGHSHQIVLQRQNDGVQWLATIYFGYRGDLAELLADVEIHPDQRIEEYRIAVNIGPDTLNDDFAGKIADVARGLIEKITPLIDDLGNESDGSDDA